MLANRETVQRLLKTHQLHARTSAGQHFLVDQSVVEKSVAVAELTAKDTVLEIGPGLGVLTEALVKVAGQVIAIEQDPGLAALLPKTLQQPKNLQVITADALQVDLSERVQDRHYSVVANLPYQITSLVLRQFLSKSPRPKRIVILIQREVAYRLIGHKGDRSLLTLQAALTGDVQIVQIVGPQAFWPVPAVTSAIVQIDLFPSLDPQLESIMRLAKLGFVGRRKQLKNSLPAGLHTSAPKVIELLTLVGIDPQARPQTLVVDDWRKLHQILIDAGYHL